jgi:hypothetical protein
MRSKEEVEGVNLTLGVPSTDLEWDQTLDAGRRRKRNKIKRPEPEPGAINVFQAKAIQRRNNKFNSRYY